MIAPHYSDPWLTVYAGDCRAVLATLPAESVDAVVTSPPYWGLRDYGTPGQLGLEATPAEYVEAMVAVFREVHRVLKPAGTVWLNLGDSYADRANAAQGPLYRRRRDRQLPPRVAPRPPGLKDKDLVGIPWRVAFALQADGWWLRSDIVWAKPNPMPESVTDRPTKAHEYVFLLTKSVRYYFDADAVREPLESGPSDLRKMAEQLPRIGGKHRVLDDPRVAANRASRIGQRRAVGPKRVATALLRAKGGDRWDGLAAAEDASRSGALGGRNIRTVWNIATRPYPGAHFAVFPPELPERCILAGSPEGGTVLDPFAGSGTVGMVANRHSRRAVLIDLNPAYLEQQLQRNAQAPLGLTGEASA